MLLMMVVVMMVVVLMMVVLMMVMMVVWAVVIAAVIVVVAVMVRVLVRWWSCRGHVVGSRVVHTDMIILTVMPRCTGRGNILTDAHLAYIHQFTHFAFYKFQSMVHFKNAFQ